MRLQLKNQYKLALFRLIVVIIGILLLLAHAAEIPHIQVAPVLLFAAVLTLSRLLDIQLPQGGRLNIDTAVIVGSILLFPLKDVYTIILIGVLASLVIRHLSLTAFGASLYPLSVRLITVSLTALVYYIAGGEAGVIKPLDGLVALTLVCLSYSMTDLAFDQIVVSVRRSTPLFSSYIASAQFLGPLYLSLTILGVLLGVMYKGMGYWSLLLFLLPLIVTRHSFKSFFDIRNVYRKTVEALANTIEAQNPRRSGHGRRVASYSVDVAKELGIHGRDLEFIGYAALLHDIGMLGVDEDSLDQLLENVSSQSGEAPHAVIGAEVVEQVDFLRDAAAMIRDHHIPVDRLKNPEDISLGARIINVASHFDKLTKNDNIDERLTAFQAISRIKKEQGIRYDPKVVRAFINVLRRQGRLMEYVS